MRRQYARSLEFVLLLHDSLDFMERFVILLVLRYDHLPVLIPRFGHGSRLRRLPTAGGKPMQGDGTSFGSFSRAGSRTGGSRLELS